MSKIKLYYTEYKDCQRATEISYNHSRISYIINLFGILGIIYAFCNKWYYGIAGIAALIIIQWLYKKWTDSDIETALLLEEKARKQREEYNKVMNNITKWKDNAEIIRLGSNSSVVKEAAEKENLTTVQYLNLLKIENEYIEKYHQQYNETHTQQIPFEYGKIERYRG